MKPSYRLQVNGHPLAVAPLSIEAVDQLGTESDHLQITLPGKNPGGEFVRHPRHGTPITCALGYEGSPLQDFGTFVVSSVELQGPPDVISLGCDTPELTGAIKAPRTRSWEDTSLDDILRTIASEHGLTPRLGENLRGVRFEHIDQGPAESDLAFLTRLARRSNAIFTVKNGRAMIIKVGDGTMPDGASIPQHDVWLDEGHVLTWDARYSDRPAYGQVAAKWTDHGTGETNQVTVGASEPTYEVRTEYPTEEEARMAASAQLDEFTREVAQLTLTLPGRPSILANHQVNLITERLISGVWHVSQARHRFDNSGLTTTLECTARNDRE